MEDYRALMESLQAILGHIKTLKLLGRAVLPHSPNIKAQQRCPTNVVPRFMGKLPNSEHESYKSFDSTCIMSVFTGKYDIYGQP